MMTKKMLTGIAVVALVGTLSAAAFAAPAAGRGRGGAHGRLGLSGLLFANLRHQRGYQPFFGAWCQPL